MPKWMKGTELGPLEQREVLRRYTHRFTRDHKPGWAKKLIPTGKPYPVQFDSDQDWLEHTSFAVRANGMLDVRYRYCHSTPTWPDNPELRKQ